MLISVIVPTRNRGNSLKKAVLSACMQSFDDDDNSIEVLIIDDNDKDQRENILSLFFEEMKVYEIKVYRNESSTHSASVARNIGAFKAKGDYICFLDDDDIYLPGRLNNLFNLINGSSYKLVSSSRIYEKLDFHIIKPKKQKHGLINLHDVMYRNEIDIGFMMKKTDFHKLGGFDESMSSLEDWDIIFKIFKLGEVYKSKRIDYIVNIDGTSDNVSSNDRFGYLDILSKYKNDFSFLWRGYIEMMYLLRSDKLPILKVAFYMIMTGRLEPVRLLVNNLLRKIK